MQAALLQIVYRVSSQLSYPTSGSEGGKNPKWISQRRSLYAGNDAGSCTKQLIIATVHFSVLSLSHIFPEVNSISRSFLLSPTRCKPRGAVSMGNIFIPIIAQHRAGWKPGFVQGWDVSGNDCNIMGPPGDLCAALLGRNGSSGAAPASAWQGTRWAGAFSSSASSPGEVRLTKQLFEFFSPAGRLWGGGGGRVIPQENCAGCWKLCGNEEPAQ